LLPKNLRIHAVLIVVCIFMILFPLYNQKHDNEKVEQAKPVAMAFLDMVDAGKYAESWDVLAGLFKEKVAKEDWIEKLSAVRAPTGLPVSREQQDSSYDTQVEGAPEGEYVMFIFDTKFKSAKKTEYVTVMLDGHQWKVAGYSMQE